MAGRVSSTARRDERGRSWDRSTVLARFAESIPECAADNVSASTLEPLCGLAQTVHQRRLRAPGQPAPGLRYVERNTVHLARAGGGVEGIAPEAGEGSEMAGEIVHRRFRAGADVR